MSFKKVSQILCVLLCAVLLAVSVPMRPAAAAEVAKNSYKVGDTVLFGNYPQTEVTSKKLLKTLNGLLGKWKTYPYSAGTGQPGTMAQQNFAYYQDVTTGGVKYRAVKFTHHRPLNVYDEFNDEFNGIYFNGYESGEVFWFRYDPIEWTVLDPGTGLLISKYILDAQPLNDTVYEHKTGEAPETAGPSEVPTSEISWWEDIEASSDEDTDPWWYDETEASSSEEDDPWWYDETETSSSEEVPWWYNEFDEDRAEPEAISHATGALREEQRRFLDDGLGNDSTWDEWGDLIPDRLIEETDTGVRTYSSDKAGKHPANDYASSSLRKWLNDTFYNTAFNKSIRGFIFADATLGKGKNADAADKAAAKDKVTLLSEKDVKNTNHTIKDEWDDDVNLLYADLTAYAVSQSYAYNIPSLLRTAAEDATGEVLCLDTFENAPVSYTFDDIHGMRPLHHYDVKLSATYTYATGSGVRPMIHVDFNQCCAGDVDGDGAVTSTDARWALRVSVGLSYFSDYTAYFADTDGNGKIEADDARTILRRSVKLEDESSLCHFIKPAKVLTEDSKYSDYKLIKELRLLQGETLSLADETVIRPDQKSKWVSTNPAVATVSANGTVKTLKKGFACIYLDCGDNRFHYYIEVITELQKRIYALEEIYPNGYYWNNHEKSKQYPMVSEIPCTDHGSGTYAYCKGQCAGFALLLSNLVFGDAPFYYGISEDEIKIGDTVRFEDLHHSVFVIDRYKEGEVISYDMYGAKNKTAFADMLITAECNWDRQCGISWEGFKTFHGAVLSTEGSYSRYK